MLKAITIFISIFIATGLVAQNYTIDFNDVAPISTKKSTTINNNPTFNFSYPGVNIVEISTNSGVYNQLIIPNTYRSGSIGSPQLISSHKLIEIPDNCNVSINIIDYTVNEYIIDNYFADNKLIPYQPTYSKNKNSNDIKLVVDSNAYIKNEYKTNKLASIKILGSLRGTRIAKISINPVEYNPTKNSIRVYNNINVEIIYTYKKSASTTTPSKSLSSPYFSKSISKIESAIPTTKYTDHPDLVTLPVKYLIVTPNNYLSELDDFIKWKTQKGFQVVVGTLDDIGATASEIKTWVHNQYLNSTEQDPAPSFLLLVGDIQQIPASQDGTNTGMATDLYYASVDGDMFPDMYYGRLPAQTTTQLAGMLAKTLLYEKYQFTDDTFLNDITLIAGSDSEWNPKVGQPTIKYGTDFYFNTANGFTNVNSYLSSYTGCYNADKIAVSMVSYTAHCSRTTWISPLLNTTAVNAFDNTNKYPVAIGNCCTSGDFSIDECIGESWIRNPNGGAVAYLGSVPDTYWWEDFYWAVGAHAPIANQYPDSSASSMGIYDAPYSSEYKTVDAMIFVGNLAVTEAHNEGYLTEISSLYYWEAYHCLGDPSLVSYLTQGIDNVVTHDPILPYNTNTFQVSASPGSLVALSNSNGLIGITTVGIDGIGIIDTDTLTVIDSVLIVVTKPQYKPYIAKILMAQISGTYLIAEQIIINDELTNNNNQLEYNEVCNLEITVKNIGDKTAKNVLVSISSNDNYIEYINNNQNILIDSIPASSTFTITSNFNIKIKDSITDGYQIPFAIELSDSLPLNARDYYNSSFTETVNAPDFSVLNYQLLTDFTGNGNNVIDYDETAILQLAVINSGHSLADATVTLSNTSTNKAINITTNPFTLDSIPLSDTTLINFEINLPSNAIVKQSDTLLLRIESGKYYNQSVFILNLGPIFFTQVGTDSIGSNSYPFNNYYQNNTTQALYLKTEIGVDTKVLNSISFDISDFTTNIAYRDLNNFKIEAIFTDLDALVSAVDFSNSQLLYSNSLYILPDSAGWEKFDLQNPLAISENKNIILQISWGQTDNYAPIGSITAINCTKTSFKSVAWGENDNIHPAPIDNTSYNRPNIQFEFDTVAVINITVNVTNGYNALPNIDVTFNNINQTTNSNGNTIFTDIYEGNYLLYTDNENFQPYSTWVNTRKDTIISIILDSVKPIPDVEFTVTNGLFTVTDVEIELNNTTLLTDGTGKAIFTDIPNGNYSYTIKKSRYTAKTGTITVIDNNITLSINLNADNNLYNVKFVISDNNGTIDGVNIDFANKIVSTSSMGVVEFLSIENTINLPYYILKEDSHILDSGIIDVHCDTIINITLMKVGIEGIIHSLNIFPNPTRGEFFIQFDNYFIGAKYIIFNNEGKVVEEGIITNKPQAIDLSNNQKGIYHLKIITKDKITTHSIMLE